MQNGISSFETHPLHPYKSLPNPFSYHVWIRERFHSMKSRMLDKDISIFILFPPPPIVFWNSITTRFFHSQIKFNVSHCPTRLGLNSTRSSFLFNLYLQLLLILGIAQGKKGDCSEMLNVICFKTNWSYWVKNLFNNLFVSKLFNNC